MQQLADKVEESSEGKKEVFPDIDTLELTPDQLKGYCHQLEKKIEALDAHILELQEKGVQVIFVTPPTSQISIKDLHVHIIPLADFDNFADDRKLGFDRIVLVTKQNFDESLLFSALHLYLMDGASIIGQVAKAWFVRIGYIKLDFPIPVLYAVFTEADCEHILDCVIDANAIITLREEVLARMVLNMQNNFRRYQDKLDTAEAFEVKAREQELLLEKKVKTDLVKLDNSMENRITNLTPRMQTWKVAVLASGWVGFLISIGTFIAILTL
jgi:hypothetical protein